MTVFKLKQDPACWPQAWSSFFEKSTAFSVSRGDQTVNIQYIPRIMHTVHALLFVGVYYQSILPTPFKVTSQGLGQSYDCPSACEGTLKNMGRLITWNPLETNMNLTKQSTTKHVHISLHTLQWHFDSFPVAQIKINTLEESSTNTHNPSPCCNLGPEMYISP